MASLKALAVFSVILLASDAVHSRKAPKTKYGKHSKSGADDTLSAILSELKKHNNRIDQLEDKLVLLKDGSNKRLVLDEMNYEAEILQLKQQVAILQSWARPSVTYIRWGRTTCPGNGTNLVYKGFAGGAYDSQKGGAANYLCLSDQPEFGHVTPGHQSHTPGVYGAEYEHGQYSAAEHAAYFGGHIVNQDVPCAVCEARRASVVMIPGRMNCYPGWTKEYDGYLAAGNPSHDAPSEFVCLDSRPEAISGSVANLNGKLFYIAEARCGSLTCPPYVDGNEMTCVVCTK